MIYINKMNKNIFSKKINYVLCDFDHTITDIDSTTSWGLFTRSKLVPSGFRDDEKALFEYYRPIELDHTMDKIKKIKYMEEWPLEVIKLFSKYNIDYDTYLKIIKENKDFIFRSDFKNFVTNMLHMNIPVFITSAGLLEPISDALDKNACNLPNITIIANEIKEINGKIVGTKKPMIHSYNKDQLDIPVSNSELGLLFGDLPGDLLMGKGKNTINVGFTNEGNAEEFNKVFDITLTDKSSFDNVGKLLIKQYKKN